MKYIVYLFILVLIFGGGFYLWRQLNFKTVPPAPPVPQNNQKPIEKELEDVAGNIEALASDFDGDIPFTVERVWVQNGNFYVEYQNNEGILGQVLIIREDAGYEGVGYFASSESGFVLQAGEGDIVGSEAILYEPDAEGGGWVRKN